MKVAVWHNNADIRVEEISQPVPGPREMLVKVVSCGICGSDVVEWYRLPRAPLVQGHEIGAQVVEVGAFVTKFKPGDRVFVAPKVPCLNCLYCREGHYPVCSKVKDRLPGGFAEFALIPGELIEKGTYPLPDTITYDRSTFIEPLACVVRAQMLSGIKPGQTILVMGCGMSGLLHIKLARRKGCRIAATDVNSYRLDIAQKMGAELIFNAMEDVAALLLSQAGRGADVVMLCTSALNAIYQAWKSVDKGGAVVFFAVPPPDKCIAIPINEFWKKEIRVLTSYYCGPPDIEEALDLISSGEIAVDDLVTHRLPLSETAKGFQLVLDGKESMKVIIKPHMKT